MTKKDSEFTNEIKRLVGEQRPAKVQKWYERIKTTIRHTPESGRAKLVIRISRELIVGQISLSGVERSDDVQDPSLGIRTNRAACTRVSEIMVLMSRTLFADGDIRTFLRVMQYSIENRPDVIPDTDDGVRLAVRLAGVGRFIAAYLEEMGRTEENGLRFGVLLCEAWDAFERVSYNERDIKADAPATRDVDDKSRLRRCYTEQAARWDTFSEAELDARTIGARAMNLILDAAMNNADNESPNIRAWFTRIVESASRTQIGSEILQSLLNILTTTNRKSALEAIENGLLQAQGHAMREALGEEIDQFPEYQMGTTMYASPTIRLDPETDAYFTKWAHVERAHQQQERDKGEAVLRWFTDEERALERLMDQRCNEIMERPRRGLRPSGYDHVEIRVSALRNVGIRAIIFRPEGHIFPDASVEIVARRDTPTLRVYKTELRGFQLDLNEEALVWREHADRSHELLRLLDFVVIDMLYRIIASPQELREKRNWQSTGDASRVHVPRNIPVPPLLRRLPEGFKSTERAQQLAQQEMGWTLRPGMTFVSAYVRNGQLAYDLPTQPTAIYTDEDLHAEID